MTVILLRHGRSTANTSHTLAGRSEGVDLDAKGREQAAAVVDRLRGGARFFFFFFFFGGPPPRTKGPGSGPPPWWTGAAGCRSARSCAPRCCAAPAPSHRWPTRWA
ncbi:histidine phosphatase family protein [Mycolicibacterium phlei]|uniref:histidine phosphatase family protein n=1 Tax=Mycolicibacterium phlei TaxID=1771 RepID=UPI003F495F31